MRFIIDYWKRLQIPTKKELVEYYPKYLLAHADPTNKILHVIGNLLTVAFAFIVVYLITKNYLFLPLLLLTPFVVYIGAWPGHFLYEKNEPATFKVNPVLTKTCDWIMIYELVTGKLKLDTRKHE